MYLYVYLCCEIKNMTVKTRSTYMDKEWIEAAERIKTIAHPVRLYIISLLKNKKEMNVGEFQSILYIEQAVVSHHLNVLKNKNILSCRRDGKNMYYSLKNKKFLNLLTCIETNLNQ